MHPNIQSKTILYHYDEYNIYGLIMVPDDLAQDLINIRHVLENASTWGKVREIATAYSYKEILNRLETIKDDDEGWEDEWKHYSEDNRKFSGMALWDEENDMWPPKPTDYYEDWMPKELYTKYVVTNDDRFGAAWDSIDFEDPEYINEIEQDFARFGFKLEEDEKGIIDEMGII